MAESRETEGTESETVNVVERKRQIIEEEEMMSFLEIRAGLSFEPPAAPNTLYKPYFQKLYADDDLHPDNCTSGPRYANTPPVLSSNIQEQDKCSLCGLIVKNRFKWNWRWHYNSLCTGVPDHLQDLCKHYACILTSQCPEFITGTCVEGGEQRFPCPAKYVCWNCLKVPDQQYLGCFDSDRADTLFSAFN